ncbi:MAG: 30S ribosomal protein S3 [Candidatus Eisenbacteria bacterium]|uniref:Small ribosomal subunit protein uS3 n=1 Tax=Eiseniibacteriota bacterium TaxID=2212470 RepID=A0A948RUI0_UNCEI|nr:30S ribosomal protein S3 [Candidatus Eisenbacteria bacterium]MBU1948465.1 30S ribosomal protein S3 [Candidatus Eisenbacteria bacterium]MBU2691125.1 30S ribosomal protein S3 [Candidatus Eisenbacteria bacterium]
MGQKTNPIGFRLGITRTWDSVWYAKKEYATYLREDLIVRKYLKSRLANSGISKITIERQKDKIDLTIFTSKPGMVIGKSGAQVNQLRDEMQHLTSKTITIDIKSVENPDADAQLVADQLAKQLEMRVSFRRAMKRTMANAMRSGAKGIKIQCSGRLGGAEMARREQYREGRVPLHTLRADIDYATSTAITTFGTIGVKTWIFKGEKFGTETEEKPGRRF